MQVQFQESVSSQALTASPTLDKQKLVTVAITPRERFSFAIASLNSILERTNYPFDMIYIDAGSPPKVRQHLEAITREHDFRLLRVNKYMSPNQARNLALEHVTTKYIVFIDNDVLVTEGWLEPLVNCAEETGAWIVAPLYLEGGLDDPIIHMAGANLRIEEKDGKRYMWNDMHHAGTALTDLKVALKRKPCTSHEFHCVLVRRDVFAQLGPLDESLRNTREHLDLSLAVQQAGGTIYFEPASVISYVPAERFDSWDLPFYLSRWREKDAIASIIHFDRKWNVVPRPISIELIRKRRRKMIESTLPRPLKFTGPLLVYLTRFA